MAREMHTGGFFVFHSLDHTALKAFYINYFSFREPAKVVWLHSKMGYRRRSDRVRHLPKDWIMIYLGWRELPGLVFFNSLPLQLRFFLKSDCYYGCPWTSSRGSFGCGFGWYMHPVYFDIGSRLTYCLGSIPQAAPLSSNNVVERKNPQN
jgi:hypothetical protein